MPKNLVLTLTYYYSASFCALKVQGCCILWMSSKAQEQGKIASSACHSDHQGTMMKFIPEELTSVPGKNTSSSFRYPTKSLNSLSFFVRTGTQEGRLGNNCCLWLDINTSKAFLNGGSSWCLLWVWKQRKGPKRESSDSDRSIRSSDSLDFPKNAESSSILLTHHKTAEQLCLTLLWTEYTTATQSYW